MVWMMLIEAISIKGKSSDLHQKHTAKMVHERLLHNILIHGSVLVFCMENFCGRIRGMDEG